jgi:cysteine desulfurase
MDVQTGTPRRYFDWAATAIPDPDTVSVPFGNPSSPHHEGREARCALSDARARCAAALSVNPEDIIFTSSGTESNAITLFSLLTGRARAETGALLLYSAGEHPSVRENVAVLKTLGIPCACIGLEKDGRVSGETFAAALRKNPRAIMAAIMAVNNETGAINDMAALTEAASGAGRTLHLHCDAVQAAGKLDSSLFIPYADSTAISAHKLGGPRGSGLLCMRKRRDVLVRGGGQEGGIRPGTENIAGAAALSGALTRRISALENILPEAAARMDALLETLNGLSRFSPIPAGRTPGDLRFSPWILQAAFQDIPGEVMVRALNEAGFAVSTGSACSSRNKSRPVLEAMGVNVKTAFSGIRISQGWSTTMNDIEALTEMIGRLCQTL